MAHQSTQFASVVQFFPASDETDYYMSGLGPHASDIVAQHVSDPTFMTDSLRRMQRLPALLTSVKFAAIDAGGRFACSGFLPGTYVLLGTLTVNTDHPAGRVHSYWRADLSIPEPNRLRSYAVSGFRYIGEVMTP